MLSADAHLMSVFHSSLSVAYFSDIGGEWVLWTNTAASETEIVSTTLVLVSNEPFSLMPI